MLLCLPECATLCRPHLIKTLCCCAALPSLSALPPLSGLPFISSLTAEPALGCLTGHSDYVTSLAASATGSTLASGSLRGEVLLWDLTALRRIMTTGAAVGAAAAPLLLACALPDARRRRRLRTACCGFPLKASSGGLRPQSNCCQSTPACLPACLSASHASPSRPSIHPSARMLPACPPAHLQDQSYGASPAEVPRDSVYALGMNADGTLLASGSTEVRPLRLPCHASCIPFAFCFACCACWRLWVHSCLLAASTGVLQIVSRGVHFGCCCCRRLCPWWMCAPGSLSCSSRGTQTTSGARICGAFVAHVCY